MILFLLKGLFRDRTRSLFPVLITASGVALTVLMMAWVEGILNDFIDTSANYDTGHLQVVTRALNEKYHPNIMELSLIHQQNPGRITISSIFGKELDSNQRKEIGLFLENISKQSFLQNIMSGLFSGWRESYKIRVANDQEQCLYYAVTKAQAKEFLQILSVHF